MEECRYYAGWRKTLLQLVDIHPFAWNSHKRKVIRDETADEKVSN
jgi:hypothetical protein